MTEIEQESNKTEGFDTSMDIDEVTPDIPPVGTVVSIGAMKVKIKRVRLFGDFED